MKFHQNGLACHIIFFTLIFGVSLKSALSRLIIFHFHQPMDTFQTHDLVHISIDIQHVIFFPFRSDGFQSVPFLFLSSVYTFCIPRYIFVVVFIVQDNCLLNFIHLIYCFPGVEFVQSSCMFEGCISLDAVFASLCSQ